MEGKPVQELTGSKRVEYLASVIEANIRELKLMSLDEPNALRHARPSNLAGDTYSLGVHISVWNRQLASIQSMLDINYNKP